MKSLNSSYNKQRCLCSLLCSTIKIEVRSSLVQSHPFLLLCISRSSGIPSFTSFLCSMLSLLYSVSFLLKNPFTLLESLLVISFSTLQILMPSFLKPSSTNLDCHKSSPLPIPPHNKAIPMKPRIKMPKKGSWR